MTGPVTEAHAREPAVMPDTPEFAYRGGALYAEDVALATSRPRSARRSTAIRPRRSSGNTGASPRPSPGSTALLCYSLKANSNLAVVATLARLGAGADVVSEGEFRRALAAGIPGNRIIFSGIGKTAAELAFALADDVHQINVESAARTRRAEPRSRASMGRTAPVAIRVNPDVDAHTHAKIATGKKENKFGIDLAHGRRRVYQQAGATARRSRRWAWRCISARS